MIRATAAVYVRQLSRTAVRDIVKNGGRGMASLSGGQMLSQLANEFPHMNAVRYEHKNQKYAFKDLEYFAESIACGFTEQGFRPGDKVLSWLPLHFSEQVSHVFFWDGGDLNMCPQGLIGPKEMLSRTCCITVLATTCSYAPFSRILFCHAHFFFFFIL
jgi:hypothetical protein